MIGSMASRGRAATAVEAGLSETRLRAYVPRFVGAGLAETRLQEHARMPQISYDVRL